MSSKALIVGFAVALAIFAVTLWYFQTHAFYRNLPEQPLEIGGQVYPVVTWKGIDATSSPLKLRACLTVTPETAQTIRGTQRPGNGAMPLVAPSWFGCFDAAAIGADLESGRATAYALGPAGPQGIDVWLALYPDGRAFKWHQLSPVYANQ